MSQYTSFIGKNGVIRMIKTPRASMSTVPKFQKLEQPTYRVERSALNGYFKQTYLTTPYKTKSLSLETYLSKYKAAALSSLSKNIGYKAIISACAKMTDGQQTKLFYFNSAPHVINQINSKRKLLQKMIQEILTNFYKKDYEGSGWKFLNFENIAINYGKYQPYKGGCGNNKLPQWLISKRAVVSILSGDNHCFYWCILRHFNPKDKDQGRVTKNLQKIFKEDPNRYADFTGINFPTSAVDLERFQNQNSYIHLIVYGVDNFNKRTPVIFDGGNKNKEAEKIFLLYYENHFYLISDLSRLLSSQFSNSNGRVYFCYKCQRVFKKEEKLNKHAENCTDTTLIQLPEKDTEKEIIEFKHKKENPPLITLYFDFESFLISCEKDGNKINKHEPAAFCFLIVSKNEKKYESKKVSFVIQKEGQDIAAIFVKSLITEIEKANQAAITDGKTPSMTPVLCHNLSGYDAHLFILKLAEYPGYLSVLPSTSEKYISFSKYIYINNKKHEIRFLDSYKFLSSPLDQLITDSTKKDMTTEDFKNIFKYTARAFPHISHEMLTRKGVYPYEYMNCFNKTKETQLPPQSAFYSTLKKEGISSDDYQHALNAWDAFGCKNLNDYQLRYCELDTMLLADVVENFRRLNIETYGLDPLFYGYTLPGASWSNMLRYTKQQIKLITDRETYEDFENGIRGGVSMCLSRYCKANNKHLSDYDPSRQSNYIFYIDKNNLYGEAMCEALPYESERKLTKAELKHWKKFNCAIVCDLEIPRDKKEFLKDYPPAPEHLKINGVVKLVPNLKNKKEYLVYSELLKYYLKLGVKITKIHRGYVFKVSKWLEPYITNNTKKRSEAKETSRQNYFKLSINSIYGKTIENPRKRSNVEIVNTEQRAKKLINSPEYTGFTMFSPSLVSVTKKKTMVNANKPLYIGFCILELSKLKMYQLYYDYLKPKFGDRVKLLYTDTDSFILEIQSKDLYEEMKEDLNTCFDTWKYPETHPLHSMENKNRLGFFKDETKGKPIKDYAATCGKSYAYRVEEEGKLKETMKLKGVVNCCINKDIEFNDYLKCIFEQQEKKVKFSGFRSSNHEIYTEEFEKIALNPLQDVRHILGDGINTVPVGYYSDDEDEIKKILE